MAIQSQDAPLGDVVGIYSGVLGATRNCCRRRNVSWANAYLLRASLDLGAEQN